MKEMLSGHEEMSLECIYDYLMQVETSEPKLTRVLLVLVRNIMTYRSISDDYNHTIEMALNVLATHTGDR